MTITHSDVTEADSTRAAALRHRLTDLKSELLRDIHGRIRETRVDRATEVVDMVEDSDDDARQGLDLALLEMRASTLTALDDAIRRLDAGRYGFCCECDRPIAERRLRALPFAVRCRECEEENEPMPGRPRKDLARRAGLSIALDPRRPSASSPSGLSVR